MAPEKDATTRNHFPELGMNTPMKALATSGGVIAVTLLHHVYGAVLYATAWRYHVAFVALPVLAALVATYFIHERRGKAPAGRASIYLFMTLTAVFSVGLIGLFEGGFNHLLKNVLYFGGASAAVLERLFPSHRYEMPDDVLFETTGILQFVVAIGAAYYMLIYWRESRRRTADV